MYMNEDVAWQRMQDLQREMENSRLLADQALPTAARALQGLSAWIWARFQPKWRVRSVDELRDEPDSATDAA